MNDTDKSRRIKTIIFSACVVLALLLIIGLISNIVSLVTKNNRIQKLEAQIIEINRQIDANEDELEYRNSGEYIEECARKLLGMKRPGEIAIAPK